MITKSWNAVNMAQCEYWEHCAHNNTYINLVLIFSHVFVFLFRGLNEDCQMLLFSATYDETVMRFAEVIAPRAMTLRLRREELCLDNIKQFSISCNTLIDKFSAISNIYGSISIGQSMIFCRVSIWPAHDVFFNNLTTCLADYISINSIHPSIHPSIHLIPSIHQSMGSMPIGFDNTYHKLSPFISLLCHEAHCLFIHMTPLLYIIEPLISWLSSDTSPIHHDK